MHDSAHGGEKPAKGNCFPSKLYSRLLFSVLGFGFWEGIVCIVCSSNRHR